jgi:hypothetical protein
MFDRKPDAPRNDLAATASNPAPVVDPDDVVGLQAIASYDGRRLSSLGS